MKLIKKVQSALDPTIKYVFEVSPGTVVEYSYIDNGSGKSIVCVPSQTMCNQKCTFCHLTDHIGKIKTTNLLAAQINLGTLYIIEELGLGKDRPLLISYMGSGEPLANIDNVIDSMVFLKDKFSNIRLGLATMLPKSKWQEFFQLTNRVIENKLNLKIHLSLHFTNDDKRLQWMPSALDIKSSLTALEFYNSMTGNPIEVHYTVMEGVNDSRKETITLSKLISEQTTIKLMRYSEKESLDVKEANMKIIDAMKSYLVAERPFRAVEYYEPPGKDIYSACGQFLNDDVLSLRETSDYTPKKVSRLIMQQK